MEKSMLDIAYDIIKKAKKGVKFADLYDKVIAEKGFDEATKVALIGRFYTDLSLDGRFVVDDNVWDLRERYTYDKVHITLDDAYQGVEEADEDEEDKLEEKEYNASIQGIDVIETEEVAPEAKEGEGDAKVEA